MKILFVTSEAVPFAKTGGLADVAGALPPALAKMGHQLMVVMPKYKVVDKFNLETLIPSIEIPISNRVETAAIKKASIGEDNTPFIFIENNRYYNRQELYGTSTGDYEDNAERFIYFCRGIFEVCRALNFQPDVIHCNDWQTGLVPVYLKTTLKDDPFFRNTSTLFTYHNIAYQGNFWHLDMHLTGLGWEVFTKDGLEFYEQMSLMKAGIVYSDAVNTVSPTYSKETQTEEYGFRLDGVLKQYDKKLFGIINGIDCNIWNPQTDKEIACRFSAEALSGKVKNKTELQRYFQLPQVKNRPVIGMVSRLADQKGFDILADAIDNIVKQNLQLVILGTGDIKYQKMLIALRERYPEKIGLMIGFDNKVAKMIYAGSDMFLMPSRFEPGGIGQLLSFRYGTVPIVRNTGGLADTVQNHTDKNPGNGFVFNDYTGDKLLQAIKNALKLYAKKRAWKNLVKDIMKQDFSWEKSASHYEQIYRVAERNHKEWLMKYCLT